MKKSVLCLLLCLFAMALASAEETFDAPTPVGVSGDEFIYCLQADNGQTLYFTSRESDPYIQYQDINFDGVPDITILATRGASNFFFKFFVSSNGLYTPVTLMGYEGDAVNFQLHPEAKLLSTHASNGYAGALFETTLYQWNGTNLYPVRKATSTEYTQSSLEGSIYTTITYNDQLHITFRDYQNGSFEGIVYHDTILPLDEITSVTFDVWMEILWKDLQ